MSIQVIGPVCIGGDNGIPHLTHSYFIFDQRQNNGLNCFIRSRQSSLEAANALHKKGHRDPLRGVCHGSCRLKLRCVRPWQ